jgi:hypothetical protein
MEDGSGPPKEPDFYGHLPKATILNTYFPALRRGAHPRQGSLTLRS